MALCLGVLSSPTWADVKKRSLEGTKKEKKENRPEIIIPEAKGAVVQFVESRSVEFELVAATSSLQQVEFLIRERPRFGILKNFQINPRENNRVRVTYEHRGHRGQLSDSFVFACRVGNGPVSAPAVIQLQGIPNAPKVEVTTQPRFSQTFVGTASRAVFMLVNRGTDTFVRNIVWPENFKGPERIVIEPGKSFSGEIVFSPSKEMTFREEFLLQEGYSLSELQLVAEAEQSLTVSPGLLELKFNESSGMREGELVLVNRRDAPVTVELEKHPRMTAIPTQTISALGSVKLNLSIPADDVDSLDATLAISGAITKYELKIQAKPSPGKLEFVQLKENLLNFESVAYGEKKSLSVIVKNAGGESIAASVKVSPPFKLAEEMDLLRLNSQKLKMFEIELEGAGEGIAAGSFEVSTATQTLSVPLRGLIQPKEDPQSEEIMNPSKHLGGTERPKKSFVDSDGERVRSKAEIKLMGILMTQGVPIPPQLLNSKLPSVEQIEVEEITSKSVVLSWAAPQQKPEKWIIQTSKMVRLKEFDMPVKVWSLVNSFEMSSEATNGKLTAKVENLRPATQYEFRVLAVDTEHKLSPPKTTVLLATLSGWKLNPWWWRVPLCLGLVFAIRHLRRKRLGIEE